MAPTRTPCLVCMRLCAKSAATAVAASVTASPFFSREVSVRSLCTRLWTHGEESGDNQSYELVLRLCMILGHGLEKSPPARTYESCRLCRQEGLGFLRPSFVGIPVCPMSLIFQLRVIRVDCMICPRPRMKRLHMEEPLLNHHVAKMQRQTHMMST